MFRKRTEDEKRQRTEARQERLHQTRQRMADTQYSKVAPALMEGEQVLVATSASFRVQRIGRTAFVPGTMAITDRRVLLVAQKLTGRDVADFDYRMITSLDYSKGAVFANIDIAAAGDHAKVRQLPSGEVEKYIGLIREQMSKSRAPQAAASEPSVADRVRDLARLRDEGLMSEEEFERKRRERGAVRSQVRVPKMSPATFSAAASSSAGIAWEYVSNVIAMLA